MKENEITKLREQIVSGIALSFSRLVEKKKKNDEEFIFSQDGKIIRIKARDLK